MTKKLIIALSAVFALSGCDRDATVVSSNLSYEADRFGLDRRIVFFNGITDKYLMVIEGRCSIKADRRDGQLEVTCRTGDSAYKKHFLGLSDNVSYFVEQLESKGVSKFHYAVAFKPQSIIPDIDFRGSVNELGFILPDNNDN